MIYLDYNATAPLCEAARAAMRPYLLDSFGNPSSVHRLGSQARVAVEDARQVIARALGVAAAEIVFTSGGTESNNLALFGALQGIAGAHLVAAATEHSSVLAPARELARRGVRLTEVEVDAEGRVLPERLAAALRPETRLVSIAWANNEVGTIQPLEAVAALCRGRGVLLHVDAVQAFGKVALDVGIADLCSVSAHKIGGPKGIGALFVRRGIELAPLLFGGGQERGRRGGTENVAAIVGFAAAVEQLAIRTDLCDLREELWERISGAGEVRRNSPRQGCLPNTLNVSFAGVLGEALVAALDLEGVAVSVGSACAAGAGEPSHVLRAMGRSVEEARDGVRFSLGAATRRTEIEAAAEIVCRTVARVRAAGRREPRVAF